MINKPVTILFEPLSLDVKFQKILKLQIAIYREANGNKRAGKIDKTDPVKFTNPQEKITFNKTLSLLTTLPFNPDTQTYENKEVDIEIALEIDGNKERMKKKISLKEILLAKSKTFKFIQQNPLISLIYRADVKLQDEKGNAEPPKRIEQAKKATKILRFDEDLPNTKQNLKQPKQPQYEIKPQRVEKGRYKTVFFEPPQLQTKIIDSNSEQSQTVLKKCKSLDKGNKMNESSQKESNMDSRRNLDIQSKMEEYKEKYQQLQKANQQLQKKVKERDAKVTQINHKNDELEQKIQNDQKVFKKQKEDLKKQQSKVHNQSVSQLKQEIKIYQSQIEKLRKTALNFQQSTKHIASGSEQEIRALKQKLFSLQRQNAENLKQIEIFEQSLKNKDQIITDLKTKIYALDKENLQLQNKIKSSELRLAKNKQEYEQDLLQLQNKIDEMKEDSKNFKIATLKDIKDDTSVDYKKQAENLKKQLDKKQELLRKMTDMKKETDNQRNTQIISLKKELSSLKAHIEELESSKAQHKSEISDIQIKIQLQKLKKEVDTCRKNEKTLLIQKGKLEASNRTLQDDIVKNKCAIANILNAVQQTGNEKLITEVYCLTE